MPAIAAPITPPYDDYGRRRSSAALPLDQLEAVAANSGLSLHANEDALRRYTDYNPDGSSRSPMFAPVNWQGGDGGEGASRKSNRRSLLVDYGAPETTLPIPDYFSHEVFRMVMNSPSAAHALLRYAQSKGAGENMAYLLKVQEYTASVDQLTTLLATISTNYTMLSATSPIHLPGPLTKSLNTDIKHVTSSILPGLENLFLESKTCIEQRLVRDVYPSFVKRQLALVTSRSLASDRCFREAEYPGLGGAFCIADLFNEGSPLEFVSDAFLKLTGRRREQMVYRNGVYMQGPLTDLTSVFRVREALSKNEECTELLINHLDDGTPFWNFIYMCPIPNPSGKVKQYLHCYINVSNCLRNSDDIVRIISCGSLPSDSSSERSPERRDQFGRRGSLSPESTDYYETPQTRDDNISRSKSSRKTFFRSFRRSAESSSSHTQSMQRPNTAISTMSLGGGVGGGNSASPLDGPLPPLTENHVSEVPGSSRLLPALELLGLGLAADAINNKDVFTVLAEQANCSSINKAFRQSVRETVINEGQQAVAEILVSASSGTRKTSMMSPISDDQGRARTVGNKMMLLNSFWTPLKDREGKPAWVMLVLIPMAM
ncbi:unnamed protein product [Parascedosporium putredinis]|uniref:RGS domain-containing protein n=1 Tax=Parascedosporium putredinis TaxID=1442378 RepID=A0A9P1H2L1_9PEZI|nr:unnamed protein product [Parascedosporium putredinis]CAI7995054.1 unnamed protein product [Parascedosporium putredinis]